MRSIKSKLLADGVKVCNSCKRRFLMQGFIDNHIVAAMERKCLCYECAYWLDLIKYPKDNAEIVGDQYFQIFPFVEKEDIDNNVILGGQGRVRYFMRPDMTVFRSNDIWLIGKIPERFQHKLPITALEISLLGFNKLKNNKRKCRSRSCMNRYSCMRYNIRLEDDSAPFNSVPDNWNFDEEYCNSFINYNEVMTNQCIDQLKEFLWTKKKQGD